MKSVSARHEAGEAIRASAPRVMPFFPKSSRVPVFRSHVAREYAYLLELDPDVLSWETCDVVLKSGAETCRPDFKVTTASRGSGLVMVGNRAVRLPIWIHDAAAAKGFVLTFETADEFARGFRLRNSKDLLRYSLHQCSLGDRIRLLAALEELGSMTVAECLPAFQEGRAMPGLASLVLAGFVEVDLDTAPIGPETQVRRIRDRF